MNSIKKHRLQSLYDISSGISSTKEQAGHGAPFVSFSTVFNNYFLPDELPDKMDTSDKEQETCSVKEGDIFLTRTSETIDELAMSCVATKDYPNATFSGFLKRLRPNKDGIAYHKYMAFYLRGSIFRQAVDNNAFMTLRASFNEEIFSYLDIYLPPYEQQVAIGDLLYAIEQKKQINLRMCAELESMAKTLYDYWFVQFDFPDVNGKPYRTSGGKMVWNDQLRRNIPEGWSVESFGDLCSFKNGINYEKNSGGDKSFRIINVRDISKSSFLIDESSLDSITLPSAASKYTVKTSDIIIARSGNPGATRLLLRNEEDTIFCGFIICCTPNIPEYLYYYTFFLKSMEGTNATKTGGSILQNVSQDTLKALNIVIPSEGLLRRFNEIVFKLVKGEQHYIQENCELTILRNELLPVLMNGQAKVI